MVRTKIAEVKNNRVILCLSVAGSLGFVFFGYFGFDQVTDKAIQSFALLCGEGFDVFPLTFADDDIDTVVGFFYCIWLWLPFAHLYISKPSPSLPFFIY